MRIAPFFGEESQGEDDIVNTTTQRIRIRAPYRCRPLFRCTAAIVLVVTGGLAPLSYANEQHPAKAAGASSLAPPAYSQLERLDEKALSAIRGKGGADALQPPINLSIILWDEPGSGGSKPHALAENSSGDSVRGLIFNHYENVSISR